MINKTNKVLKRFIFSTAVVLMGSMVYLCYVITKLHLANDYSEYHPDISQSLPKLKMEKPVYLVSYASGPDFYKVNQRAMNISAINQGIHRILQYTKEDLPQAFMDSYPEYFGPEQPAHHYWVWKPYFIKQALEYAEEDALIVYADSAFWFLKDPSDLLEQANENQMLLVYYSDIALYGRLSNIASRALMNAMHCPEPECRYAPHIWAAFGIFKNTPEVREFVDQWLQACLNPVWLKHELPRDNNFPENAVHQDDETLLGIIHAKSKLKPALISNKGLRAYVLWHHRKTRDPKYHYSLLPLWQKNTKNLRGFERDIYNSAWFARIRAWLKHS